MKRTIIFESELIILDIEPSESDEIISERVNFIIKNKDKNEYKDKYKDYNKLVCLSKLFVNKKYKQLEYSEEFNDLN